MRLYGCSWMNSLKNVLGVSILLFLICCCSLVIIISIEIMSTHCESIKKSVKLYTASFFNSSQPCYCRSRKKIIFNRFLDFLRTDVACSFEIKGLWCGMTFLSALSFLDPLFFFHLSTLMKRAQKCKKKL